MNIPMQVALLISSFLVTLIGGSLILPLLKKLNLGQNVRVDGPESHLSKSGTPSMGGMIFLIPFVIFVLILGYRYEGLRTIMYPLLVVTLAYGGIGFLDDYLKVKKKSSTGLLAWQKMLLLLVVSGGYVYYLLEIFGLSTHIYLPFFKKYIDLGMWYIPFAILVLVSTTNVVNITDGLDGLAGGIMVIMLTFFAVYGIMNQINGITYISAVLIGACLGFLVYNINPARVFMGDTGSLALGGFLGAVALMLQLPLILLVIAGICVIEALSDIIQVIYFKLTHGKRIFKMAPLHHHLELSGWSEKHVTRVFYAITIILCVIGILIV
ncbi:MAG: phospho-N-acetylmuramoyl-pentapeptide-transferase [Clostridiales bacterium]|nr:phospho-N-acetylmuramoyl-pentapeptide-transferase [Clostridiales bacterium]